MSETQRRNWHELLLLAQLSDLPLTTSRNLVFAETPIESVTVSVMLHKPSAAGVTCTAAHIGEVISRLDRVRGLLIRVKKLVIRIRNSVIVGRKTLTTARS